MFKIYSEISVTPKCSGFRKWKSYAALEENSLRCSFSWKKFLIIIGIMSIAAACGYVVFEEIQRFEYFLYTTLYESTSLQIHTSIDIGLSNNFRVTENLATTFGLYCPTTSIWPNCSIPSYSFTKLVKPLKNIGLLGDMSLIPLLRNPPTNVKSFEAFAYNIFSTDPGYSPTSGISVPFGKGIYAKYSNGSRYHDVTGTTTFSKNKILCPVFAFGDNFANKNAIMFNLHSEFVRAEAIDLLLDAFDNGRRNATSVTRILQLVQNLNGVRPACLMLYPIAPAKNFDTIVGFVSIIQNWDAVIGRAIPTNAKGMDFVLSDSYTSFTYTITTDSTVTLKGKGDLHETLFNLYKKSYSKYQNAGYASYSITYYPNSYYFPPYLNILPILGCLITIVIVMLLSTIFGLYIHFLNRKLLANQTALDSKRSFVRFISHEIRTPLNTVCLGLKLLRDETQSIFKLEDVDVETGKRDDDLEISKLSEFQSVADSRTTQPCQEGSLMRSFAVQDSMLSRDLAPHAVSVALSSSLAAFASSMNTPQLLKEKVTEWVHLINDIEESSTNAVKVLNEFMSYDKIEMRTLHIEKEVLPICALLQSSVKPFYIQAREKGVNMSFRVETNLSLLSSDDQQQDAMKSLVVLGDQIKLNQVFRNLVSNALKFTDPKGTVSIVLSWVPTQVLPEGAALAKDPAIVQALEGAARIEAAGTIRITVEDSGAGLSVDNLKMLFKEGVQFNANSLQAGGGSGLGLWITKGLVNLHGGVITAASTGLGQGATFKVELPVFKYSAIVGALRHCDSNALADSIVHPKPRRHFRTGNIEEEVAIAVRNVLIVDDAMLSRKMVNRLLTNLGCRCKEACNGAEAVELMKQCVESVRSEDRNDENMYQLVIMDFEMPVMKGPDATAELRRLGFNTLIVGITGNVMESDVSFFMSHGADAVIAKPLSFLTLTETIKRFNCSSLGDHIL